MLGRIISTKGGIFLIILLLYILFLEGPLVRFLNSVLPQFINKKKKVLLMLDFGILVLLARATSLIVWEIFNKLMAICFS